MYTEEYRNSCWIFNRNLNTFWTHSINSANNSIRNYFLSRYIFEFLFSFSSEINYKYLINFYFDFPLVYFIEKKYTYARFHSQNVTFYKFL